MINKPYDNMRIIKKIIFYIWSAIVFAASFFSILFGVLNLLNKLGLISFKGFIFPVSIPISLIAGVLLTVLIIKDGFALFWVGKNGITINLAIMLLGFFLSAFQTEIIIPKNQLKELITVEWMIFAISITIFVLLVTRYKGMINSVKSKKGEEKAYQQVIELNKRMIIHANISAMFAMIILLFVNVISLILSTGFIYLITEELTIFTQNTVLFSFFSSISVVLNLFVEIIRPLYEAKKKRENDLIITKEDLQVYRTFTREEDNLFKELKKIERKLKHKDNLTLEETELIRKGIQRIQTQMDLLYEVDEETQQEDNQEN